MSDALRIGDRVKKIGGDYTFTGTVVAAFDKRGGQRRYVAENDDGVLHIYSGKNLRILPDASKPAPTPDSVQVAARKVADQFRHCQEPPGGWLSCVVSGADRVIVMATRRLHAFEEERIPKEVDGILVEVKVVGRMRLC